MVTKEFGTTTTSDCMSPVQALTWTPKICERCKIKAAVWRIDDTPFDDASRRQADMTFCDGCDHDMPGGLCSDYTAWAGCEHMDLVEALDEMRRDAQDR